MEIVITLVITLHYVAKDRLHVHQFVLFCYQSQLYDEYNIIIVWSLLIYLFSTLKVQIFSNVFRLTKAGKSLEASSGWFTR